MRHAKRLPLEELQPFLIPDRNLEAGPADPARPGVGPLPTVEPLAWPMVFGNPNPVEIEVGFGKGLFLLTASAANPGTNYLGIEIVRKYVLLTATRLATRSASGASPNVRVACADAKWFLRERVSARSVRAIHVYFPDPWWKKRHHKRRLFTSEFVDICERALEPAGRLHVVTDVAEYFGRMVETMAGRGTMPRLPMEAVSGLGEGEYLTNFERKYRIEGRPIHRAAYEKRQVLVHE